MRASIFNRSVFYSLSRTLFYLFFLVFFLTLTGFFFLWQPGTANAQTTDDEENANLHIISDKMTAQQDGSIVEFIGNVKATRLDSVMFADAVTVYFSDKKTNGKNDTANKIKQIISKGNVEYTQGERKAFADKAVYTTKNETLVLTGKTVKLIDGSSHVTGSKITLFRNDNRAIVESDGTNRVEALFNPKDTKSDKP